MRKHKFPVLQRQTPIAAPASLRDHLEMFTSEGKRRTSTEVATDALLLWLNGWQLASKVLTSSRGREELRVEHYARTKESATRILELFRFVLQIAADARESSAAHPGEIVRDDELQKRMNRYVTYPDLVFLNGHVASSRVPHYSGATAMYSVPGFTWEGPETPAEEYAAAYGIIDLCAAGLLERIRQCKRKERSECETWFFAERDHGEFCSEGCRVAFNQKKPENLAIKAARANLAYHKKKADLYRKAGDRMKTKRHADKLATARKLLTTLEKGIEGPGDATLTPS